MYYLLLFRHFKRYGDVGDIYIPRDRNSSESRGFAFVRFYEERDAEDAMDAMDGKVCSIYSSFYVYCNFAFNLYKR